MSASGLFLPDSASNEDIAQGIVQAVGPGVRNEKGDLIPVWSSIFVFIILELILRNF